ncbi:hypothetical protein DPMN_115346 [Dreissena polymorpha]|uniref:Uncharacterized protein n=1 Tax=Dreissena polymorpha TaxID=45954 RepID=A0A9D4KL11_DREPO|nr:hypothetical protein DPMN_115346 [Dreissena polymorpha]
MPIDLGGEEVAQRVDQVTGNTPTKKGYLKLGDDNHTISLINHPSKVMLRIILNRLKGKAEGGAEWNRSSTAESSSRHTCNSNVTSSTPSSTLRKLSTACGIMTYGML